MATERDLGLSIVYAVVKHYGAEILVDSQPGHGTAFKIYFPGSSHVNEAIIAEFSPAQAVPVGGTILVIEDDDQITTNAARGSQAPLPGTGRENAVVRTNGWAIGWVDFS